MQCVTRSACRLSSVLKATTSAVRCTSASPQVLTCGRLRYCTAEAIAPAQVEGEKDYAPKIKNLVKEISQLTLIEVADLNELLKSTLKIADTPMMAMGAMPAGQAAKEEEDDAPAVAEKTVFTVKLTKFDAAKKVALIKEIKNHVEGMNLVQAKKFVESAPQVVKTDIPKDEAEKLKEILTAAGATVEID